MHITGWRAVPASVDYMAYCCDNVDQYNSMFYLGKRESITAQADTSHYMYVIGDLNSDVIKDVIGNIQ